MKSKCDELMSYEPIIKAERIIFNSIYFCWLVYGTQKCYHVSAILS